MHAAQCSGAWSGKATGPHIGNTGLHCNHIVKLRPARTDHFSRFQRHWRGVGVHNVFICSSEPSKHSTSGCRSFSDDPATVRLRARKIDIVSRAISRGKQVRTHTSGQVATARSWPDLVEVMVCPRFSLQSQARPRIQPSTVATVFSAGVRFGENACERCSSRSARRIQSAITYASCWSGVRSSRGISRFHSAG